MSLFEEVRVFKTRPTAKLPHRAHATDAGLDLFYCPGDDTSVTLPPSTTALFPTGLKIQVPKNCMLHILNKSGIAYKRSLLVGACVVDEGYTGEVFVNLHNAGKEPQTIHPGQKVAQGVFVRIEKPAIVEIEEDNVYETVTSRGTGALGSTGDV